MKKLSVAADRYEQKMGHIISSYKKRASANDTEAPVGRSQLRKSTVHPLVLADDWKDACLAMLTVDSDKRTPEALFSLRKYLWPHVTCQERVSYQQQLELCAQMTLLRVPPKKTLFNEVHNFH
jgi:hypothetical protein